MTAAVAQPAILGDWGGTRLRLWLRHGGVTIAASDAPGLLVAQENPSKVLRAALGALGAPARGCRIVLCGMAGARGGLAEVGYVPCPGGIQEWLGAALKTTLDGRLITILPGFSSRDREGRPDVMRGEEAQVFGALARRLARSGEAADIVLPGTHSKWVRVKDSRIVDVTTCPTGELHARLLGSSMAPREDDTAGYEDEQGFAAGIDRARDSGPLIASLFEARSAQLLDRRSGDWARGFLSGLLIGSEIGAMTRPPGCGAPPLLVGSARLVSLYRTAFARLGLDCRTADGALCAIEGLEIAHARLG